MRGDSPIYFKMKVDLTALECRILCDLVWLQKRKYEEDLGLLFALSEDERWSISERLNNIYKKLNKVVQAYNKQEERLRKQVKKE